MWEAIRRLHLFGVFLLCVGHRRTRDSEVTREANRDSSMWPSTEINWVQWMAFELRKTERVAYKWMHSLCEVVRNEIDVELMEKVALRLPCLIHVSWSICKTRIVRYIKRNHSLELKALRSTSKICIVRYIKWKHSLELEALRERQWCKEKWLIKCDSLRRIQVGRYLWQHDFY